MFALMNFLVRSYTRVWDKELREIAHHCDHVQLRQLEKVASSTITQYINGKIEAKSYEAFKAAHPLTQYDDIRDRITLLKDESNIKCEYFAQSAGTTSGIKKLIPTSERYVRCNHLRGSWYLLHTLYKYDENMSVFKTKNLLIGGSLYERHKSYTIGDISGIMLNRIPQFFRPWYVPSTKTAVSPNWHEKIEITATEAASEKSISLIGGTPTWVISLLKKIQKKSGKKQLSNLWPNLKAYIHGGVNFTPYRYQMDALIGPHNMRYIEVYNASEGFFAYQDRPDEEGMLLMCASGLFFEFVKYEDYKSDIYDAIFIKDVQLDTPYVMVISTISGLLRYVQGDVITFVTLAPYRIKVINRISDFVNAFGEDLMTQQVEQALLTVNAKHQTTINHFTIAPYYITTDEKGKHEWFIEFEKEPSDLSKYTEDLDQAIRSNNTNYAQKRAHDLAMTPLKIYVLPKGKVSEYFKKYGTLGGQSKLQKLRNDRSIADRLLSMLD